MTRALVLPLCLLAAACTATVSPTCSDRAYAALTAKCVTAAVNCRQQGGTESECGSICDAEADAWESRCGQ